MILISIVIYIIKKKVHKTNNIYSSDWVILFYTHKLVHYPFSRAFVGEMKFREAGMDAQSRRPSS